MSDVPREKPLEDPVARLVTGYLLDRVKEVEGVDQQLLEQAMELYRLVEEGGLARRSPEEMQALRKSPVAKGLLTVLGGRARRVADLGLRIVRDNRAMMSALRERLQEKRIDPSDPAEKESVEREYEHVLVETVPLETSLENVAGIADTIDLANEALNPKGRIARRLYPQAIDAVLPLLLKEPELRSRVEALRRDLSGRPERLEELAEIVRREGPGIVHGAYERGRK